MVFCEKFLYPDNYQPSYISTSFGATVAARQFRWVYSLSAEANETAVKITVHLFIQKWLVQHHLSQKVRCYFSGINEEMLRPFLDCVGVDEPTLQPMQSCFKIDNICIFPFLRCGSLYTESPKIDNANEHLQPSIVIRCSGPCQCQGYSARGYFSKTHKNDSFNSRVLCVHSQPPAAGANLSDKTQIGKNYLKIKEFFKMDDPPICEEEYVMTADQKSQFREQCINGDTLSFTVLSEKGKEDTIIAATQYRRSDVGAWVNYFATSAKCVKKAVYGGRGVFCQRNNLFEVSDWGLHYYRQFNFYNAFWD
jgi:hypothetical protein